MGTISNAAASASLTARLASSRTNVSIAGRLTESVAPDISDADIAYSFKITSAAAGNVATLNLTTSTVAQTTGTPTIEDGDGNDFEGVDIPDLVTLYAIMFRRTGTAVDTITIAAEDGQIKDGVFDETTTGFDFQVFDGGIAFGALTDIVFTFADAADVIEVTVIGKSS